MKTFYHPFLLWNKCICLTLEDKSGNKSTYALMCRLELHRFNQQQQLPWRSDRVPVWRGGYHGLHGLFQFLRLRAGAPVDHVGHLCKYLHDRTAPAPTDRAQSCAHTRSWRNNLTIEHISVNSTEGSACCQIVGHHCRFVCSMLASAAHHQLFPPPVSGLSALTSLGDEHCHHPLPC